MIRDWKKDRRQRTMEESTLDPEEVYYELKAMLSNKLASLEATLVQNYDRPTKQLTGMK